MEPKFEFVGSTDSGRYNVKTQAKNNRIFHIKKTYPDGRETYCEYTTNRVNVNSICLRCTNRKCKGTLILETSQPTHVARRQVLASGKERNIYDFTESADLSDDTKYGNPHHKHVNTANCRFRDGNNECKATKHHFTARDDDHKCETDFPRNFSRDYHKKCKDIVSQNPFTPNDRLLTNFNTTEMYEGTDVPAGFLYYHINAVKVTVGQKNEVLSEKKMPGT